MISIEEIKIGDYVLSYNKETGKDEYEEVLNLIQHENKYSVVNIKTESGDIIVATDKHPFYVDGDWRFAESLTTSDELFSNSEFVKVSSIYKSSIKGNVFNLNIDKNHNYYVGNSRVLVHNCNPSFLVYKVKFGLSGNRQFKNLTDGQITKAFRKNGYKIDEHVIDRLRHVRTNDMGVNTLNDVGQIINVGKQVVDRGAIAFIHKNMKVVVNPSTMKVVTIRPLKLKER